MAASKTWAFFFMYEGNLTGGPKRALDTAVAAQKSGIRPILVSNQESPILDTARGRGMECRILQIPPSLGQRRGKALTLNPRSLWQIRNDTKGVNTKIRKLVQECRVDGWWARGIKAVLMARGTARREGIPLIWDMGAEYKSRGLATAVHFLGFHNCTRAVAQGQHVLTQTFPRWLLKRYRKKCHVLMPGLTPERVGPLQDVASTYCRNDPITIIGTINSRKNQLLLIKVCNALFAAGREFRVRFVGPSTDEGYFEECQRACDAYQERYHWHGWSDQIPQILAQSSAVAVCSKQEGMPQIVLEAMHAGRPVVSVPVGGVPDIILNNENGFLSTETSYESYKDCLLSFLNCDGEALERMRYSAQKTVMSNANFESWECEYAKLLTEVLD